MGRWLRSYFAGAPGGCSPRNSCHRDRPIVQKEHPDWIRHVDVLEELRTDILAVSMILLRPRANHRVFLRFASVENRQSFLFELLRNTIQHKYDSITQGNVPSRPEMSKIQSSFKKKLIDYTHFKKYLDKNEYNFVKSFLCIQCTWNFIKSVLNI